MKKILQLSTYPVIKPNHGGQFRVDAIRQQLLSLGYIVTNLSLSEAGHSDYSIEDLIIPQEAIDTVVSTPFCGDLATSILCVRGKYLEFLTNNLNRLMPDIIFLEQPWLWPAVKLWLLNAEIKKRTLIVYSSHNVEYLTKKSILESHGIFKSDVISQIRHLEIDLCASANLVISVSRDDEHEFQLLGAQRTIILPNGVRRKKPSINSDASQFFLRRALLGRKFALFVGSSYPPNAQGFWHMTNHSLSFLRHDEFIVVAGGVSDILLPYGKIDSGVRFHANQEKLILLGKVSDDVLDALLNAASAVLLPITSGGGSNLKTAEAILSCKPIVATSMAFRGYDLNFIDKLGDISICNDSDKFRSSISDVFSSGSIFKNNEIKSQIRDMVLWDFTLMGLGSALSSMMSDSFLN